jgi:hypothetical protein
MRFFRLSDGGVRCGEDGLFIGSTPLLVRSWWPSGGESWAVRPNDELERDLGGCYGLPIDIAAKHSGLTGVARALERGDMALAKIAALLLRFPDPPSLAKGASDRGSLELAAQLFESGLFKGDWDPAKHPRTGTAPNPGQFAVKPDKGELTAPRQGTSEPSASTAAWQDALQAARELLQDAAKNIVKFGRIGLWITPELKALVEATLEIMTPSDTLRGEQQVIDQVRTSVDPPKTLEEYKDPTQNVLGYERHHIVEQNKDNVAKGPIEITTEKFGRDVIDDPSNIVWVPRLKHELITAYYNSGAAGDSQKRLYRQVVNAMDYQSQREAGLAALQLFGVLQ